MRGLGLKLWLDLLLFLHLICQHNLCNWCSHLHWPPPSLPLNSHLHHLSERDVSAWALIRPAACSASVSIWNKGYGTAGALTHADPLFIHRISTTEACLFLCFHIFSRRDSIQRQQPEQIKGDLSACLMGGALYCRCWMQSVSRFSGVWAQNWRKTFTLKSLQQKITSLL